MGQVKGCHLVGSICLPDAETVFRKCNTAMPNLLRRIPDGETGVRKDFILWQEDDFFRAAPEMLFKWKGYTTADQSGSFTPEQISAVVEKLRHANPSTGYDEAAIQSYKIFSELRQEGVIKKGVRFQVSLPTYVNVIVSVERDFQVEASKVYEAALLRDLRRIQDAIPHEDLAIQLDLALDTMFWEDPPLRQPWFYDEPGQLEQRRQYIVEYIVRMISWIDQDVDVGIHNCYGDHGHVHWREPDSLHDITERALALFEKTPHPINFFHLPVPLSAMDKLESYFTPLLPLLPKLREHNTELYLGLVHYDDLEGTRKRIEAAKEVLGNIEFGVATECGFGRTPSGELENIFQICRETSEEVL